MAAHAERRPGFARNAHQLLRRKQTAFLALAANNQDSRDVRIIAFLQRGPTPSYRELKPGEAGASPALRFSKIKSACSDGNTACSPQLSRVTIAYDV
jgi:hypothetical protein